MHLLVGTTESCLKTTRFEPKKAIKGHINVAKKGIYEPGHLLSTNGELHEVASSASGSMNTGRRLHPDSSCTEQTAKMRNAEPKKHESAVQALHPPLRHPALFAASGVLRQRIRRSTIHCIITSLIDED